MQTNTSDERGRLLNQAIAADTFDKITAAREALKSWAATHPGDAGIDEVEEALLATEAALAPQTEEPVRYMTTEPDEISSGALHPGEVTRSRPPNGSP